MAEKAGQCEEIHEILYTIKIENVKDFRKFCTNTFYVCGNSWSLVLRKEELTSEEHETKENVLAVYLISKREIRPENWAIVANFTLEISSIKSNSKAYKFVSNTFVFDSERPSWGEGVVILWKTLVDPEHGYVYNDTCKIVVKVRSSPLQYGPIDDLIELEPIYKCCDASQIGSFRLKVMRVHDFVDICSPEFILKNMPWRFLVCKTVSNHVIGEAVAEDMIQLKLYNPLMGREATAKCIMATLSCKIDGTTKKMENIKFEYGTLEQSLNIISWNGLFDPQKKCIENDSFILEVRVDVFDADQPVTFNGTQDDRKTAIVDKSRQSETINVKAIGNYNGTVVKFKVHRNAQLKKLMNAFSQLAVSNFGFDLRLLLYLLEFLLLVFFFFLPLLQGLTMQVLQFRFDGQTFSENETPAYLEMEEGDIIDVFMAQRGG